MILFPFLRIKITFPSYHFDTVEARVRYEGFSYKTDNEIKVTLTQRFFNTLSNPTVSLIL